MNDMQRGPRRPLVAARPAGASDEDDSNSDRDDYDFSGLRKLRNRINHRGSRSIQGGDGNREVITNGNGHSSGGNAQDYDDWESSTVMPQQQGLDDFWGKTPADGVRLACIRGNLEKLKDLLEKEYKGSVNNFFGGREENPLIVSCLHGQTEVVEFLLKEKTAKPDLRHPVAKMTALMAAIGCEEINKDEDDLLQCVEALASAGANLNLQDRYGLSALMVSIQKQQGKIARYLIEKGADPNLTDPDGQSALFYAAKNGDGRLCRLLLENKADIEMVDNHGWSAPEIAQDKGFPELSDLLHFARNTKWSPGLDPSLMSQIDEDALRKRKETHDSHSARENSSIELILTAVEGGKYLEHFRKHKISYVTFLKLDDNQLKEIGIEEIGIREKICEYIKQVHNTSWQTSSLHKLIVNKNVSAAEAVCMVVNINEHLEHISGSLQYLRRRITENPLTLKYDVERNKIDNLIQFCDHTEKSCEKVRSESLELAKVFKGIRNYSEFQTVGKIPKCSVENIERKSSEKSRYIRVLIPLGIGVVVLIACLRR